MRACVFGQQFNGEVRSFWTKLHLYYCDLLHYSILKPGQYTGGTPSYNPGVPPGYNGRPPGYNGIPPGYSGVPPGYNGVPPGYSGVPPGYNGVPPGYNGVPPGYNGVPPGYNGVPPSYNGVPPGGIDPSMIGQWQVSLLGSTEYFLFGTFAITNTLTRSKLSHLLIKKNKTFSERLLSLIRVTLRKCKI